MQDSVLPRGVGLRKPHIFSTIPLSTLSPFFLLLSPHFFLFTPHTSLLISFSSCVSVFLGILRGGCSILSAARLSHSRVAWLFVINLLRFDVWCGKGYLSTA